MCGPRAAGLAQDIEVIAGSDLPPGRQAARDRERGGPMARKKDDQPPDLREIASRRTARDKARAKAAGEARKEDRLFERFMSGRGSVDPVRGRMGARGCRS